MTENEADKIVAVLIASFPASLKHLSPSNVEATANVYNRMLRDLDYTRMDSVMQRVLTRCRFLPTIAELREAYFEAELGPVKPGAEGWGDVLEAVRKYGSYRTPIFDDPIVAKVVSWMGWREICLSENATADRARFIEAYDRQAVTERRRAQTPALPGETKPRLPEASDEPAFHLPWGRN